VSTSAPLVSVILSTYNRSNVLALAIRTALWQTVQDIELWVVGDACTDDTGEVVRSFRDPRIHFVNLEQNVGEQSGPNNEGFRRSRGRYVAYLGQDDLWFPDHLETALATLDETGADWVFTLVDFVKREGEAVLIGAAASGRYAPHVHTVPSSWVLRRESLEEIGPWRSALESYATPQDDFLGRAYRNGKDIRLAPRLTVVKVPSGLRPNSYARREEAEIRRYFEAMTTSGPEFRESELTRIALGHAAEQARPKSLRWHASRAAKDVVRRAAIRAGVHPHAVHNFLRFHRKGAGLDDLRRVRGLPPLARP
jgi:glycosyltransferase involved in cell wall biosynthesis